MKNFKNCFPMNRAFEWRIASGKMAAKHLHRPTDFGGRSWTVVWTVVWIVSVALSRFLSLYMTFQYIMRHQRAASRYV